MRPIRAVFQKEVTDNFRDRRTLMSALLMGPLFGPILFAFVINMSVKQSLSDVTQALDVPVIGFATQRLCWHDPRPGACQMGEPKQAMARPL